MTSPDGITWTSRSSAVDNQWTSVNYGNGVFVAVAQTGTGNRVMTSTLPLVTPSITIAANPGNSITTGTAVTFTATPTNGGSTPAYQWKKNGNNVGGNSVTYTDATLENGDIITCVLTSNDPCASPVTATSTGITMAVTYPCPAGTTWTSRTSAADNTWRSVTYGNGIFVAVSQSGTGNRVMTSSDGITWTSRTSAADNFWTSVTYGNGLFVAVSLTGTGNRVMTSPDGITWTSQTSAADNLWNSVTYGNGLFVAVSTTSIGNRVMTSPDGITWTLRTSSADNQWTSVTYGNGLFVAVSQSGTGNRVMTSPDGITWTSRTSAADNNWFSVTYGNGLFVAVAFSGIGNRVMTSPDGINWTSRSSAADNEWRSITYGNGLFVALSTSGTGNRVMTSPDGITWTSRSSAVDNQWLSVTYGNGLFVAVANSGTSNRVMTSSPPLVTPSITIAANPGNSITTGTSVTFTATPTNGGSTPAYQWKKNNNNVGSNSVTYTDAALQNGDIITCVLTSNDPCASPTTATSAGITMIVTSTNANLSALTTTAGAITPTFNAGTLAYTASVANVTTSITVTPTSAEPNATITVNGAAVTSGSASGAIALAVGANTITTVVTAQDGTTTKTYTLTVTRESTLPVSLNEYNAKLQTDGTVLLTWDTFAEQSNDYFEISKSTDGQNFVLISTIKGNGTTTQRSLYNYTDRTPKSGDNYYKLVQVDLDGAREELGIRSAEVALANDSKVTIYPNPSTDLVNIVFEAGKFISIELIDLNGRLIQKKEVLLKASETTLEVKDLPSSSYLIKLVGNQETITRILIVKR